MFWENLPIEIRIYILSLRNDMRDNFSRIIQKKWQKFQAPKKTAIILWEREKLEDAIWMNIINPYLITDWQPNVMLPSTSSVMKYCVKVLSGKENPKFWSNILKMINKDLWLNQYSGGPGAEYYSETYYCFDILSKRFNLDF